jgi:hypothetical protein
MGDARKTIAMTIYRMDSRFRGNDDQPHDSPPITRPMAEAMG